MWSGQRGKKHCVLAGTITCPKGSLLAITPGLKISSCIRGGDATTLASGLHRALFNSYVRLLRGTPEIGVCVDHDRGFIYIPHNVNIGDALAPVDWFEANNIASMWRFKVFFRHCK